MAAGLQFRLEDAVVNERDRIFVSSAMCHEIIMYNVPFFCRLCIISVFSLGCRRVNCIIGN